MPRHTHEHTHTQKQRLILMRPCVLKMPIDFLSPPLAAHRGMGLLSRPVPSPAKLSHLEAPAVCVWRLSEPPPRYPLPVHLFPSGWNFFSSERVDSDGSQLPQLDKCKHTHTHTHTHQVGSSQHVQEIWFVSTREVAYSSQLSFPLDYSLENRFA